MGLLGVYMILLFPDGKLPSRKWRPLAWFAGAVIAIISVGFAFVPGPVTGREEVRNPFGLEWLAWVADAAIFVVLLLPLCILGSALSLVLRYRRSGREVRLQIKWLAFAASFVGVAYLGSLLGQILLAPESLEAEGVPPLWTSIADDLVVLSYAGIPVAVGVAILRYRLYDIDLIINRALVYGPLTVLLGAAYAGGVVALQYVLRALTGQESQLAVVGLHPRDRGTVQPATAAGSSVRGPPLLPPQVRRRKNLGRLQRSAARGDRPGRPGRRPGGGGKGHSAARARLLMAAS